MFAMCCSAVVLLLAGDAKAAMSRFVVDDLWIKDVETGVVWSRDANLAGQPLLWSDAHVFIKKLNKKKFAGHKDWRLPDLDEMRKFLAATRQSAGVDSFTHDVTAASTLQRLGFKNVQSDYWSSTTSMYYYLEAWYMSLQGGTLSVEEKSLYLYVWPVRWEE